MQRISDERFLTIKPDLDSIVGIRVKDGEFYFLAWMEDAPNYKIQKAMSLDGYLLDRHRLIIDGDIFANIQDTEEYNKMYYLYQTDDEGHLINEDEYEYVDEYEEFLSLIKCYERNGKVSLEDHDILVLSKEELSSFCDLLRDGDYVLVIEN